MYFNTFDCSAQPKSTIMQENKKMGLVEMFCENRINEINSLNSTQRNDSKRITAARLQKRNERERNRVEKLNKEFRALGQVLSNATNFSFNLIRDNTSSNSSCSYEENDKENMSSFVQTKSRLNSKSKHLSKVKILQNAIDYISYLTNLLENDNEANYFNNHSVFNDETCFDIQPMDLDNYYF